MVGDVPPQDTDGRHEVKSLFPDIMFLFVARLQGVAQLLG